MKPPFAYRLSTFAATIGMTAFLPNISLASTFEANIVPYYYQVQEAYQHCYDDDSCPDISISYLRSNAEWAEKIINAEINRHITGTEAENEADKETLAAVTFSADGEPQIPEMVGESLHAFSDEQFKNEGAGYQLSVSPNYHGHIDNIELFSISTYEYIGGAHGSGALSYFMLDSTAQKRLVLDDLLIGEQKSAIKDLFHEQFRQWLVDKGIDPKTHEADWEFILTENVIFTGTGLKAQYQAYEIAPYAEGMPAFVVPYEQLTGVLKPEYIPQQP